MIILVMRLVFFARWMRWWRGGLDFAVLFGVVVRKVAGCVGDCARDRVADGVADGVVEHIADCVLSELLAALLSDVLDVQRMATFSVLLGVFWEVFVAC